MTDDEREPEDVILQASRDAAMRFAAVRFGQLTARLIWRLRRMPASGVFGDDYGCRTLWDEYCFEVQDGPFEMPEPFGLPDVCTAFAMTIDPFIKAEVERLPRHEAVLLTLWAINDLDEDEQAELAGSVYDQAMIEALSAMLRREAGHADLGRLRA